HKLRTAASCILVYQSPSPSAFYILSYTSAMHTLSLHDALPISRGYPPAAHRGAASAESADHSGGVVAGHPRCHGLDAARADGRPDRKSTRLNSSHVSISYAVFCLKKKKMICKTMLCNMSDKWII